MKTIFKKWWFWLIIVVIAVAAVTAGGGNGDSQDNAEANETVSSQTQTDTQQTSNTNEYKVGDTIDANGFLITYVKAEEYESGNMFLQPEDGMKYIRIYITAQNNSTVDRFIWSSDFECYADNIKMDTEYLTGDNLFTSENISAGRQAEGYFYFSVPKDAENIEIEYETSFWTDKKAILKVEI